MKCQHTWNAVLITVFGFVVVGQSLRDLSIAGNMTHSVEQLQEHKQQLTAVYRQIHTCITGGKCFDDSLQRIINAHIPQAFTSSTQPTIKA